MSISLSLTTPIYYDNISAIKIAHNDVFYELAKHIEIDCHFVGYHLFQGLLQLNVFCLSSSYFVTSHFIFTFFFFKKKKKKSFKIIRKHFTFFSQKIQISFHIYIISIIFYLCLNKKTHST
jgi:hypothetical protein